MMFMGIDQYGQTWHLGETKYPRKALLEKTGRVSADKMYVDTKDGGSAHIGYVVKERGYVPLWVTLYEVRHWHGKEK
jgi:hypothetical protein